MKKCVSKFRYWQHGHLVHITIWKGEDRLIFSLDSGNKEQFYCHEHYDRGIKRYLEESPYIKDHCRLDDLERLNR